MQQHLLDVLVTDPLLEIRTGEGARPILHPVGTAKITSWLMDMDGVLVHEASCPAPNASSPG